MHLAGKRVPSCLNASEKLSSHSESSGYPFFIGLGPGQILTSLLLLFGKHSEWGLPTFKSGKVVSHVGWDSFVWVEMCEQFLVLESCWR